VAAVGVVGLTAGRSSRKLPSTSFGHVHSDRTFPSYLWRAARCELPGIRVVGMVGLASESDTHLPFCLLPCDVSAKRRVASCVATNPCLWRILPRAASQASTSLWKLTLATWNGNLLQSASMSPCTTVIMVGLSTYQHCLRPPVLGH
jgi:hypothetical protein